MKTIYKVAKTELRSLFYSPIAWFLLIVFLIQCGIIYLGRLANSAMAQELSGVMAFKPGSLTDSIFLSRRGLFATVMQNLYLYIPLLTMSLISRETSSGTIKLLYSSPIRVSEIVFGKFLAMMVYSLLLVAVVGVFVLSGAFQIQHQETDMLLTALLGFYLLLCTYSAIGLFMSCLTTYQVVAAISTFVMIGILSYIGTLWQSITFVRELTYFLSINGRTQKMLVGLVTTKDVIYFLVIVYIFLGLSIYKLKAGMESKSNLVKAGRYAAIIASALLIGYISSIPRLIGYYDATKNQARTLTPQVQKVLEGLGDEPLEVTAYNNLLGKYWYLGSPESYNGNLASWESYMRFKDNIKIKTVLYYDTPLDNPSIAAMYPGKTLKEIAEQYATNMDMNLKDFKSPEEIHKIIDLGPEQNRYVMELKWKGRKTFLRVFEGGDPWPSETEVAAALLRLQQSKLPKIVFLTGDLERDINKFGDRDYKALTNLNIFRYSFINQGFDVGTVSLETQDIPADVSTLVVADPKMEFRPVTMAKLQAYINNGGNLLIAGEPGKQSLLNPLLKQLGVQLINGTLIQQSTDLAPNVVTPSLTNWAGSFTKTLAKVVAVGQKVFMPGAAGISFTSGGAYLVKPLLMTDAKLSWNMVKPFNPDIISANATEEKLPKRTVLKAVRKIASVTKPVVEAINASTEEEESKKRGAALQAAIAELRNGPGTPQEKQVKMFGLIAAAKKRAEARLTPEMKKTRDSLAAAVTAIMNGPGTIEEKEKKMQEAVAKKTVVKKEVKPVETVGQTASVVPEPAGQVVDQDREASGTVNFSPAEGDIRGPIAAAVTLTRNLNGKEQRIVVTGDADFLSNVELGRSGSANFVFNTALFSWLNYGKFPIDTSRPESIDTRVNVNKKQVDTLRIVYIWVLPGLLFAFGAILLIRRKRK